MGCAGFTFAEVNSVRASSSKVVCCHFSSDGKLLVSGGHDKKVRVMIGNGHSQKLCSLICGCCYFCFPYCDIKYLHELMQAVLWFADTLKPKTTLEEHTSLITDVRFSPSMARLATSSFDKTVRVWDVENVSLMMHLFCFEDVSFFARSS